MAADAEGERIETTETDHRTEHVPEWKREEIDALRDVIDAYDSVGIVSIAGIPSRQLQVMRADLYGRATLRVARNTLLLRALEETGAEHEPSEPDGDGSIDDLRAEVAGQVGVIATDDNPFGLFRQLEASKTPAPINPGETAPNDIVIPAGDTGIDPGPFVGELQQVGAAARIMEGSIRVTENSTVLEEGEVVSRQLANVLNELEIEPKEVGLDLKTVYSEGTLFEPAELALDIDEYRADFETGAARARSLSIGAAYPTTQTAPALLAKGVGEARTVGLAGAVESPDLVPDLLSRASGDLRALAARIDDEEALPAELRDVSAPEPATEDSAPEESVDETGDEPDTEPDEPSADDAAEDEGGDDDDDDAGGEGLGAMFG